MVYSVIWIILLFLVVWPLGWFLSPIWIVLLAGEAFLPPVRELNRFIEKLLTWPRTMGYAIQEGRTEFPTPLD
ncbi:hypothetical protein FisN_22Hh217 [Fistulifera solaris]|uniref:Uncharacterized protein n=1 Tax=Fistulifera solaris TaxID=1519565 RepID=A0A1Z5JPG3_FISSO|nr:hypothetical protein FisN_22Hh217 [Fistulifera solaris]|eukprot:GAX15933.1 hypothetical protein FisN_22Hh217 [Fistulifera solaris]